MRSNNSNIQIENNLIDVVEEDTNVTGTKNVDWNLYDSFKFVVTGVVTFSDINLPPAGESKVITLDITGNFAITWPAGWETNVSGTYDGTLKNTIVVEYYATASPFYRVDITQPD